MQRQSGTGIFGCNGFLGDRLNFMAFEENMENIVVPRVLFHSDLGSALVQRCSEMLDMRCLHGLEPLDSVRRCFNTQAVH